MAMEMHVLSDRRLNSIAEWQRAIDAETFPLRLDSSVQFNSAEGFLPSRLVDKITGFECYHDDANHTMNFLGVSNFGHRWKYALGFRWRGDAAELQAAWMAATAYAAATGGIVFDHEEGKVFTPPQARETVRDIVRDLPAMEAILQEIKKKFAARS
jgi:hypothetical protein